MQLTQDAVDRILQDSREEGFSFLDREALDEWLRDHDVEAVCGKGRTLLLWAAARRRYDAIRELLARGADPNARDMKEGCCGRTALFWAVETMHFDTVRLLVRHGARVDDFDLGGLDFGLNQPPQTALQNLMFTRYRRIRRDEYSDDYELEVPEHHWRELECMVKLLLSLGATVDRHVAFPLELSHWAMARCSVPPELWSSNIPGVARKWSASCAPSAMLAAGRNTWAPRAGPWSCCGRSARAAARPRKRARSSRGCSHRRRPR